jgi:hypothetical protein
MPSAGSGTGVLPQKFFLFFGRICRKTGGKIWWGSAGYVSLRSAFGTGAGKFFKSLIIRGQVGFGGKKLFKNIWLK